VVLEMCLYLRFLVSFFCLLVVQSDYCDDAVFLAFVPVVDAMMVVLQLVTDDIFADVAVDFPTVAYLIVVDGVAEGKCSSGTGQQDNVHVLSIGGGDAVALLDVLEDEADPASKIVDKLNVHHASNVDDFHTDSEKSLVEIVEIYFPLGVFFRVFQHF